MTDNHPLEFMAEDTRQTLPEFLEGWAAQEAESGIENTPSDLGNWTVALGRVLNDWGHDFVELQDGKLVWIPLPLEVWMEVGMEIAGTV